MNRTALIIISIIVLAFRAFGAIPPIPPERDLFNDLAGIVDDADERSIRKLQDDALRDTRISIVVVTIDRMRDYLPQSRGIEDFARQWFVAWQVGGEKGEGILILVSSKDRKSRIQLGSAWDRDFDDHCKNVMNDEMVPQFKKGEFGAGLVKAVQEMEALARGGPGNKPPEKGLREQIDAAVPQLTNPITRGVLGVVGAVAFILALRGGNHRRSWLSLGALTLGCALLTGLMLPGLVLWLIFGPAIELFGLSIGGGFWDRSTRSFTSGSRDHDRWDGGSSSGGGDSGGGASGSW